ncbi:sodium:solute symporter [Chloracidobacterium validum]|uniref:Sodium:solute symporter n=1 Tax=Chloracidobacterium validum TaxID=2821543 RepID=A0ABX8BB96_9BACT|nr:sodium:solute symporter [Chloracidobacterium validum]QUW04212.1 sodium:solute symporter [Chloracidobacterium validum]
MTWLDWVIIAAYFVYLVVDGFRAGRRGQTSDGYFRADRSLGWWTVGLSVMATQLSAITLVGATGQGYADGMRFVQFYFALPIAMVMLCVTAVPGFYRANVFTAYEFLERRFDARTRAVTSVFFLLSRGLATSVVIAAPAVVLSAALGWSEALTILVMGIVTTLYTVLGGVRAVAWNDVKQMAVIVVGLVAILWLLIAKLPPVISLWDGLQVAGATGRLTAVDWRFDWQEKYTVWSGLFASLFLFLSYFGCDQSQVQRYLAASSIAAAQRSLLLNAVVKIPLQALVLLIGVLIFVFYVFAPAPPLVFTAPADLPDESARRAYAQLEAEYAAATDDRRQAALRYAEAWERGDASAQTAQTAFLAAQARCEVIRRSAVTLLTQATGRAYDDTNYVFPTFVLSHVPSGLVGLILAAILAAAMSTSAGELNALATTTALDIYQRWLNPAASETQLVRIGQLATAFWGGWACVGALYAARLGSLIEVVNRFGSWFYGALLGVFVLAAADPRANGRGAVSGLLLGMGVVWALAAADIVAFLWLNAIGCLVTVVVGVVVSRLLFDASR